MKIKLDEGARVSRAHSTDAGLDLEKHSPECGSCGWCDYPLPDTAHIFARMHLNKKQSFKLALKLLKFAFCGWL